MNYVFGPVPSRRLGQSLGIDTIPLKTCNWNCVYCQLGRTRPLTNLRREYFLRKDILAEARQALADSPPGAIDWITFVGSGEPTLHSGLGWLLRQVKTLTNLPVAVITNGALLYQPEVREELLAADAVLPSLDAGNSRLYRKINRPHPEVSFDRQVDGMKAFRCEYLGQLWVEVMLLHDLNDSQEALQEISEVLDGIHPDQVHILLPVRLPAECWVQPSDEASLQRAHAILGKVACVIQPAVARASTHQPGDLDSVILGIITRHPMREVELCAVLGCWLPGEVHQTLENLRTDGKAQMVKRNKECFWSAAAAHYDAGDSSPVDVIPRYNR